jgi:hypothetical protein
MAPDRLIEPLEFNRSKSGNLKPLLDEAVCCLVDDDFAWARQCLQPLCPVRRAAYRASLMERTAGIILPHKNSASRNTDPHRQKGALGSSREHIDQVEGGGTSANGVILTCTRIAEID